MLIDSHAHLDFPEFQDDRDAVVRRALDAGVVSLIDIGTDLGSSQRVLDLAGRYPQVYAAAGIHPHHAQTLDPKTLTALARLAESSQVVAIGEIGLDFYRDRCPRPLQREAFRQQIRLAVQVGKPLVIHDREAHGEVLQMIRQEQAERVGGVLHCFSGDLPMAEEAMAMGFSIAFGGTITYGGPKRQDLVRQIPLERILVETDCPFLTPVPHRGKRNEPAYVRLVAEKIAQIRGISFDEVAQVTTRNAVRLFGLENPRLETRGS